MMFDFAAFGRPTTDFGFDALPPAIDSAPPSGIVAIDAPASLAGDLELSGLIETSIFEPPSLGDLFGEASHDVLAVAALLTDSLDFGQTLLDPVAVADVLNGAPVSAEITPADVPLAVSLDPDFTDALRELAEDVAERISNALDDAEFAPDVDLGALDALFDAPADALPLSAVIEDTTDPAVDETVPELSLADAIAAAGPFAGLEDLLPAESLPI